MNRGERHIEITRSSNTSRCRREAVAISWPRPPARRRRPTPRSRTEIGLAHFLGPSAADSRPRGNLEPRPSTTASAALESAIDDFKTTSSRDRPPWLAGRSGGGSASPQHQADHAGVQFVAASGAARRSRRFPRPTGTNSTRSSQTWRPSQSGEDTPCWAPDLSGAHNRLIVIFTSDRGLASAAQHQHDPVRRPRDHRSPGELKVVTSAARAVTRAAPGCDRRHFEGFGDRRPSPTCCRSRVITDDYVAGTYDRIDVVYSRFVSTRRARRVFAHPSGAGRGHDRHRQPVPVRAQPRGLPAGLLRYVATRLPPGGAQSRRGES